MARLWMSSTSPWEMAASELVVHAHSLDAVVKFRKSLDDLTDHIRIIHIQYGSRLVARARGLGVMTSP